MAGVELEGALPGGRANRLSRDGTKSACEPVRPPRALQFQRLRRPPHYPAPGYTIHQFFSRRGTSKLKPVAEVEEVEEVEGYSRNTFNYCGYSDRSLATGFDHTRFKARECRTAPPACCQHFSLWATIRANASNFSLTNYLKRVFTPR